MDFYFVSFCLTFYIIWFCSNMLTRFFIFSLSCLISSFFLRFCSEFSSSCCKAVAVDILFLTFIIILILDCITLSFGCLSLVCYETFRGDVESIDFYFLCLEDSVTLQHSCRSILKLKNLLNLKRNSLNRKLV